MRAILILSVCLSVVYGQSCSGRYDSSLIGQCELPNNCAGTTLSQDVCGSSGCCIGKTVDPAAGTCLNASVFTSVYDSVRGAYLAKIFNSGFSQAGICSNCQAKAAFLAISAAMTEDFQTDEKIGASFSSDDFLYGNNNTGDGSLFRQRGFFGLRGKTMYQRVSIVAPLLQVLTKPENAAIVENSIDIAARLWRDPTLQGSTPLTSNADGTFYGFSLLWWRLTGSIEQLPEAAIHYSKFLRLLQCGGDLYPGQGARCQYNSTHPGYCIPDCIVGLEESGDVCGCEGDKGAQCPNGPPHIRCCLGSCSQDLKMDLGFVLDASNSIAPNDYTLQKTFTKDLLGRLNVGRNKTHVGIINFSTDNEVLTRLNTDYTLDEKRRRVDAAKHYKGNTYTAAALQTASNVFSYANGLRQPEEGAAQVMFVITDGASNNEQATVRAAAQLKDKGIHIVSVGVGNQLRLSELYAMCTPPSSENYFAISDYSALQNKLNQFTAKTCSEPTIVPINTTVTGECGKDKYKFLKLKIVVTGNKIMIKIKLFNGKVKLFYSFTIRNPKDPLDFSTYLPTIGTTTNQPRITNKKKVDLIYYQAGQVKQNDDLVTLVLDKPEGDVDSVFIGVKGVEEENKFEVNLEDCAIVDCRSSSSSIMTKFHSILFIMLLSLFVKFFYLS